MTISRIVAALGIVAIALGSCGCGSPQYQVPATLLNGKVTVDGKPVSTGNVIAYQGGTKTMEATIELDGSFVFADPPSGQYQLTVTGTDTPNPYSPPVKLPAKYANPSQSGLTATVTPNQVNTQDLVLRTK